MGIFNEFNKKEKPVFTGITRGIGGFAFGAAAAGGGGGAVSNISASGGVIHEFEDSGTKYRAHIFFNPGTLAVTSIPGTHPGNMTYLLVGGGGGAAGDNGAGGGGGGVYAGSTTVAQLTYPVTTGIGGKGIWTSGTSIPGLDGTPSIFVDPSGPTTRNAGGGGGGGAYPGGAARAGLTPGGSGGGGRYNASAGGAGNTDAGAQNGGTGGTGAPQGSGGGGGAGGTNGTNAGTGGGGNGGEGYQNTILGSFIPAANSYWGGGGGGIMHPGGGTSGGDGGKGGGGAGSDEGPASGTGGVGLNQGFFGRADPGGSPKSNGGGCAGFATGGGGGGGGSTRSGTGQPNQTGPRNYDTSTQWFTGGGDGAPGICVFRYELDANTDLTYTKATGGFTHKDDNGDVYHVFTGPTFHGTGSSPSIPAGTDLTIGGSPFAATVLLVGGGGGSCSADSPNKFSGGGGGAGGVLINPNYTFTNGSDCKIVIGSAGMAGAYYPVNFSHWQTRGHKGDRTALLNPAGPFTHSAGGGGGGGVDLGPGGAPGEPSSDSSGGGGAGQNNPTTHYGGPAGKAGTGALSAPGDGTGTWTAYANNGGAAAGPGVPSAGNAAGGGGGAAGAGSSANSDTGAAGGAARGLPQFPDSLGVGQPGSTPGIAYFAGGGGGGSGDNQPGGNGGGAGAGGNHPSTGGTSEAVRILLTAKNCTGSGGGGGGTANHTLGGPGGPGVLIIKYPS